MARNVWIIAALGGLSLAATITVALTASGSDDAQRRGPLVVAGIVAPDVELPTLDDKMFRLSTTRGAPTILTFGASWCHPCREEYPRLERIRMQTPDLKIIGVLEEDSPRIMQRFMREVGANWPVLDDNDGVAAAKYGVDGLPVTFFIDRSGTVTERITGLMSEADLAKYVRRIMSAPTATTVST